MSANPGRRPRRSGTRPGGPSGAQRSGASRTTRRSGSRPAASRPATAPTAAATGSDRRAGRGTAVAAVAQQTKPARSTVARQVAALGLVLCAVALTLAYPLRNYLAQREALAQVTSQQQALDKQIADLQAQQAALSDPDYIAAQAKERLRYVSPGDTVYRIVLPAGTGKSTDSAAAAPAPQPWFENMWDTLSEPDGASAGG
jgi:cell division protein FtsB